MFWIEKIDWIKKRYSTSEFSVPHIGRKDLLRKIESKFITRPKDYYHPNNFTPKFGHWWEHLKAAEHHHFSTSHITLLHRYFNPNDSFWVAFELYPGIRIYKAKRNAICDLSQIGLTWARRFYVIYLKLGYMVGFEVGKDFTKVKV